MDIREFYRSNQQTGDQNNNFTNDFNQNSTNANSNTAQGNHSPHKSQDFSEYQDTINKYKDLSQNELYSKLLEQATDLKAQGKLDENTLNTISNTLSPMLNDEQKQLLNNIIERIK